MSKRPRNKNFWWAMAGVLISIAMMAVLVFTRLKDWFFAAILFVALISGRLGVYFYRKSGGVKTA